MYQILAHYKKVQQKVSKTNHDAWKGVTLLSICIVSQNSDKSIGGVAFESIDINLILADMRGGEVGGIEGCQ